MSDNNISKIPADLCSRLPNIQNLYFSQNPINDLDDIKGISHLTLLKSLWFGGEDFSKCNIVDIKGYKEFILTTVKSQFFCQLDGCAISNEDIGAAKKNYMEAVLELQ